MYNYLNYEANFKIVSELIVSEKFHTKKACIVGAVGLSWNINLGSRLNLVSAINSP